MRADAYANEDGRLVRTDNILLMRKAVEDGQKLVPFATQDQDWDGNLLGSDDTLITGIGVGTTYPDYKPAPFIVSQEHDGVDTVTVVSEGHIQLLRR